MFEKRFWRMKNEKEVLNDYEEFKCSGLTLNDFFRREIIYCSKSHHDEKFVTDITKVEYPPVFVGFRGKVFYIINLSDVKCKPIKISIENLFLIYGISHSGDPIDVYDSHKVNLVFRKIEVSYS